MLVPCWRWFGPADGISLEEVVQTGASGVVTALHQVPVGQAWEAEDIRERRHLIERAGLKWEVVESIPVHEDIKLHAGQYELYVNNFKTTLQRLAREGIRTVCYNFMPALDWSRTELAHRASGGAELSSFNFVHFAAIDIHILKRPGAAAAYPEKVREQAEDFFRKLDRETIARLTATFLLGFPGSGEQFTMDQVLERIAAYEGMDKEAFRSNLAVFLNEVVPVAGKEGVRLAIHPDDPPWPLMGMPRVFSSLEDAEYITRMADSPFNGITLCTGSLGALHSNDPASVAEKLAPRVHFAHLRNVCRDGNLNFEETHLLEGQVDMTRVMTALVKEDLRRMQEDKSHTGIPVRPDHGAKILGDYGRKTYPGYSLYGRMKSLAEIRGLELGIRHMLESGQSR